MAILVNMPETLPVNIPCIQYKTVSYTHLDVYKRQQYFRPDILASAYASLVFSSSLVNRQLSVMGCGDVYKRQIVFIGSD